MKYECTESAGPDGRATFGYFQVGQELGIRWRRIGRHDANRSVAALLDQLTSERATGQLTLEAPGRGKCSLYMIFGHIFHAEGPLGEGDVVLNDALTWSSFTYSFDKKAKLPPKETIGQRAS